ncbi:MAG TPA: FkbM family methyltransferase [Ferruginibacter sp.]|mgnify:CR=1 FL=1|nr:FkbM family methyltransferase [Ferruginibacter sp.]HMP19436.1 FkbM family methyltransferase [Ferruginibacter sp.]
MINTKPIYNLLEKITFGKGLPKTVNGVPVMLPAKYIRYFPSNYEAENFAFLKSSCKEGAVVLDIGAHIGLFSAIAAKVTGNIGKVFAFEPAPKTLPVLHQTIRINSLEKVVEPINDAMGSSSGSITFYASDEEADNSNSLISYKEDRKLNGVEVNINTIDNFVASRKLCHVDFIKIDVEGAEYDTLRGGMAVLKKFRPAFILAIHPEPIAKKGDRLQDIYDLLTALNYNIACNNKPITKADFCSNTGLIDLHCTPVELQ